MAASRGLSPCSSGTVEPDFFVSAQELWCISRDYEFWLNWMSTGLENVVNTELSEKMSKCRQKWTKVLLFTCHGIQVCGTWCRIHSVRYCLL